MTHCNSQPHQSTWRIIVRSASAAALSGALTAGLLQPAYADHVPSQPVPPNLEVPPGNEAFLVGYAVGTQNYVCLPSGPTDRLVALDDQERRTRVNLFAAPGKYLSVTRPSRG